MAPSATVEKPLNSTSPAAVIDCLHNHDLMVRVLSPTLISYELTSGDPSSGPTIYSVTDKRPVGQMTWKLTLTNQPEGVDSKVDAKPPMGSMIVESQWRVVDGVLREEAMIEGNMLTKKMARGNVEKQHPEAMDRIMAEAAKA